MCELFACIKDSCLPKYFYQGYEKDGSWGDRQSSHLIAISCLNFYWRQTFHQLFTLPSPLKIYLLQNMGSVDFRSVIIYLCIQFTIWIQILPCKLTVILNIQNLLSIQFFKHSKVHTFNKKWIPTNRAISCESFTLVKMLIPYTNNTESFRS